MNKLQENYMIKIGIPQQVIDDMNQKYPLNDGDSGLMRDFEEFLEELEDDNDFWGTEEF